MNAFRNEVEITQEIDNTLSALSAVRPRDGLEQRVLARIASAPEQAWFARLVPGFFGQHRWMLAAASTVLVAGAVTAGVYRHNAIAPLPAPPAAAHIPHAPAQPATAAAGVSVNRHPLDSHTTRTRHRGVRPGYRATHDRVPLPRGTAVPLRPRVLSNDQ